MQVVVIALATLVFVVYDFRFFVWYVRNICYILHFWGRRQGNCQSYSYF